MEKLHRLDETHQKQLKYLNQSKEEMEQHMSSLLTENNTLKNGLCAKQ